MSADKPEASSSIQPTPATSAAAAGIVDVHAHLTYPAFSEASDGADAGDGDGVSHTRLDSVLRRAAEAGVTTILAVAETVEDAPRVLELARLCADTVPAVAALVGLHPVQPLLLRSATDDSEADVRSVTPTQWSAMEAFIRANAASLCGIGEVGLDFTPRVLAAAREAGVGAEDAKNAQREVLRLHARLALELGLPLNVHSRSAGHHAIALLREVGMPRDSVLMHAFDGRAKYAVEAAKRDGYLFSVPPSVVRGAQFQKLVKALPLSALCIETDSPALGPVAGEDNEPANAVLAVREVARLHCVSEAEVVAVTTANARRVFPRAFVARSAGDVGDAGAGAGAGAAAVVVEAASAAKTLPAVPTARDS